MQLQEIQVLEVVLLVLPEAAVLLGVVQLPLLW